MGIFKVSINIFFLFIFFQSCKTPQKEKTITKNVISVTKDSLPTPKYPSYLDKNYILGKFDCTKNPSFIKIPKRFSTKTIYLRKDVFKWFNKMHKAAAKDSIQLTIISGTRNFEHQKSIWNYKWNKKYKNMIPLKKAKKILEYSAMPSTSRHHWGTDIDLNSLKNSYFLSEKGKKEYTWLVKNAAEFGFYQVYTSKKEGRKGYQEEKWHWSYAPLSSNYLEYFNEHIKYTDLENFKGALLAKEIDIISNYVNGINPKLLNLKY